MGVELQPVAISLNICLNIYFIDNMVKTITIKEDVYKELIKVKSDEESFSDLFERLIKSASPRDVLKKIRGSVKFRNKKGMILEVYSRRAEMRP